MRGSTSPYGCLFRPRQGMGKPPARELSQGAAFGYGRHPLNPAVRQMRSLRWIFALLAALCLGSIDVQAADLEDTLYIDVPKGRVVIEMRPDLAPNHVAQIKELARKGFYDGVPFHRVIDGFMAQTGDPTGTGSGGSGNKVNAEFSNEAHVRGTV